MSKLGVYDYTPEDIEFHGVCKEKSDAWHGHTLAENLRLTHNLYMILLACGKKI